MSDKLTVRQREWDVQNTFTNTHNKKHMVAVLTKNTSLSEYKSYSVG